MRQIAVLLFALALAGCGKDGPPYEVNDVVADVQFVGAHQDRHCSKGCRYVSVPDKWFLSVCKVDMPMDCGSVTLFHPPWEWQQRGQKVTVAWQRWSGWNTTFAGIRPTETGKP